MHKVYYSELCLIGWYQYLGVVVALTKAQWKIP